MRILILADIHANLNAFNAVIADAERFNPDGAVFLGDLIDYGMRPNEVIAQMERLPVPLLCALQGNHEHALLNQDWINCNTREDFARYERQKVLFDRALEFDRS